jgi:hypothetical protein
MLSTLAGSTLGVWVSHGEGRFQLPYEEDKYQRSGKICLRKPIRQIRTVLIIT